MEIKYHGHSCFELSEGETTVLVDPFLKPNNPAAVATAEEVEPTVIAITHGHADHMADAVPVAKRTGAHCVAIVELAEWLKSRGIEALSDPNLGGTVSFDWGWIKLVPAWHTNTLPDGTAIGPAAGMLIKIGETTVYHAGDTCLFSDMMLIAQRSDVDVFLVPIGGHYTMDRHDAVVACQFVGAETVIPMHYDTFPPIETDSGAFKADVEAQTSSRVVILEPGQTHGV
jgi:L-ascorbate metabolism protein UlaG (beta-lactamase superfamily)